MNAPFIFVNERDAPSVDEQPSVAVGCWRVIEAANGHQHLLAILESGAVRMTSPLAGIVKATGDLVTQSGRRYELLCPPETRHPQVTVLLANAARSGITCFTDVSDSLWQAVRTDRLS
jgi:hypothetical protein